MAAAAYNRVRRRGERQAVQKAVDLYRRNDASPLPLYASPVAGPIDPATGLEKGAADTGLVDRLAGWLTSSGHGGLADKLQKGLAWAGDKLTDDRVQSGLVGASLGGLGGLAVRGHAGDALAGAAIGGAGGAAFPGLYRQVREAYRGDGDSAKPERPAGLPSPGDSARLEKRLQELTPPAAAQVAADVTDRASELKRQMADTTAGQVVGGIGDAIDTTAFGKNPLISRAGGLMSDAAAGVRSQAIRQMAGNGPGTPNAINSPVGHLAIPLGQLSFAQGLDAGGQAASAVGSVMQSPAAQSAGLGAGLAGYNLATRVGRQGTAKFDAQLARSAAARGMAGPQVELKDLARRMGTTPDLLPVEKLRASPLTGKINPRLVGGKVQAAIALAPLVRDWLGRARGAFADNADSVRQMKAERDKLLGGK